MEFQAKELSFMDTQDLLPEELDHIVEILHGQHESLSRKVEFPWDISLSTSLIKDTTRIPESGDSLRSSLLHEDVETTAAEHPGGSSNVPPQPPTSPMSRLKLSDDNITSPAAAHIRAENYPPCGDRLDIEQPSDDRDVRAGIDRDFTNKPYHEHADCGQIHQNKRNNEFHNESGYRFSNELGSIHNDEHNSQSNGRGNSLERTDSGFDSNERICQSSDFPDNEQDAQNYNIVRDSPHFVRTPNSFEATYQHRAPYDAGRNYIEPEIQNRGGPYNSCVARDTRETGRMAFDANGHAQNFIGRHDRSSASEERPSGDNRGDSRSFSGSHRIDKPYERRNKKRRPPDYYQQVERVIAENDAPSLHSFPSSMPPIPHMISMQHGVAMPFHMPINCMSQYMQFMPYHVPPLYHRPLPHMQPPIPPDAPVRVFDSSPDVPMPGLPQPPYRHHHEDYNPRTNDEFIPDRAPPADADGSYGDNRDAHGRDDPADNGGGSSSGCHRREPGEEDRGTARVESFTSESDREDYRRRDRNDDRPGGNVADNTGCRGDDAYRDDGSSGFMNKDEPFHHGVVNFSGVDGFPGDTCHRDGRDSVNKDVGRCYNNENDDRDGIRDGEESIKSDHPQNNADYNINGTTDRIERLSVVYPDETRGVAPDIFPRQKSPEQQSRVTNSDDDVHNINIDSTKSTNYSDPNSNIRFTDDFDQLNSHESRVATDVPDEVYHDAVQLLDDLKSSDRAAGAAVSRGESGAKSHLNVSEMQNRSDIQFIYEDVDGSFDINTNSCDGQSHFAVDAKSTSDVPISDAIESRAATEDDAEPKADFCGENKRSSVSSGEIFADALSSQSDGVAEMEKPPAEPIVAVVKTESVQKKSWADLVKQTGSVGMTTAAAPTTAQSTVGATTSASMVADAPENNAATAAVKADRDVVISDLGRHIKSTQVKYHPVVALQPRGLANNSNWCYVNATLQALLACTPMYHLLTKLSRYPRLRRSHSSTPILDALVQFFSEFSVLPKTERVMRRGSNSKTSNISTGASFSPKYIYSMLQAIEGSSSFKTGRQEDAEEFLGLLLNGLHDEMTSAIHSYEDSMANKGDPATNGYLDDYGADENDDSWERVGPKNRGTITRQANISKSPISEIFSGELRSSVSKFGQKDTVVMEPFFTLQLDIQNDQVTSVLEALERLVNKESVINAKSEEVYKRMTLDLLPPILILHLKFFQYNKNGGCQKCNKKISYSRYLEINKEVLSPKSKVPMNQRRYELFAVVYHIGKNLAGGHYTADIYHTGYGSWIRYDDESITPITMTQVFSSSFPRVPYLLYYKRIGHQV